MGGEIRGRKEREGDIPSLLLIKIPHSISNLLVRFSV
jgi:hypothetical protein